MAIEGKVSDGYVGGSECIGRAQEWRCLALLRVEILEILFGRENGSKTAAESRDGARYRMRF
jgi:hypothetical protein